MRLPTTLALFVSLCVPAFAAPAEVPYEQLAKRFINNIGDVDRQNFASISAGNVIAQYNAPRNAGVIFEVSF